MGLRLSLLAAWGLLPKGVVRRIRGNQMPGRLVRECSPPLVGDAISAPGGRPTISRVPGRRQVAYTPS